MAIALVGAPASAQQTPAARAGQLDLVAEAQAENDFERARQILLPMIAASPQDPDLLRRLAVIEAGAGRLDLALERIDEAAQLAPKDLDIALARGFILYWRGDVAEAQRAAIAITARDPDFPELDQLEAALARQNRPDGIRTRSIFLVAGFSDITTANGFSQTWNSQAIGAAFDLSRDNTLTLDVIREERSAIDTRLGARVDHRLAGGSVYVSATAVPAPDFQEKWSVGAGGELKASQSVVALIDLRLADYQTGTIAAVQPGLRVALCEDFAVTGRAINIFDGAEGYRLGGSVRLDYGRERETALFLIAASYPDAEADGVRQLRSLAAGLRLPVAERIGLTVAGSHEDRDNSYRRYAGTVALTYRFPAK
ncbi:YaiO family outer membrane beta-barrel protein [Alteriqipengyuania sp.]|uniref:YaiO family outer membrane beta-barrel protein n=1 Tax=Alteriqipengyuania sp. TaxID=2800692 RepID=UPI0035186EB7